MSRKTTYQCTILLASLGLIVAACGSGDGTSEGEDAVQGRSILQVAHGDSTEGDLTPHNSGVGLWVLRAIHAPLLEVDENNEFYSDLLESWEIADDARTVTLTLRPDLEWNDGTPITSTDAVMSLTQYLNPDISMHVSAIGGIDGQQAFADGETDSISGISAPDDTTVVIELAEPNAAWLADLALAGGTIPVLPHHVLGDVPHDELLEHEYFDTHPVSSGPYQFVERVEGQYIKLEKNPDWSNGEAGFEEVFFKVVDPNVRAAQLESGEVQMANEVQPSDADHINAMDGIEIQAVTGASPNSLHLSYYEPLLDPRVRQAMAYAIDREGICEAALQGYCSVPPTNLKQVGPEWAIPTEDMIEYPYDPDRARQLLDEAGWDPDTTLTMYQPESRSDFRTAISIAQDNMADVGLNWEIVDVDLAKFLEGIENTEADAYFAGGGNFAVDPSSAEPSTSCDTHYPDGGNITHYCDPELDELWAAGRETADQDERAEIYHEAFRRLNENPPEVNLFVRDNISAYDSRLKGVKVHPSDANFYWNIGDWHWEE